mgnify:FL=1
MCVFVCLLDTVDIWSNHPNVYRIHKYVFMCILGIVGIQFDRHDVYLCVHVHFGHGQHSNWSFGHLSATYMCSHENFGHYQHSFQSSTCSSLIVSLSYELFHSHCLQTQIVRMQHETIGHTIELLAQLVEARQKLHEWTSKPNCCKSQCFQPISWLSIYYGNWHFSFIL